jgi:transposase-like protein
MKQSQNDTEPEPVSEKQERAIAALLPEPSVKRAAAATEVGESTLWRWLKDDDFRAAYLDARRKSVQQAAARIQHCTSEAASVVQAITNDGSQPGATRIAAAKAILQNAMAGIELEDYERRLAAIETHMRETVDAPKF